MLNDYLQFAKTQIQEETTEMSLVSFFNNLKKEINSKNLKIEINSEIVLSGRRQALKRCFINLIQNGLIYGKHVYLKIQTTPNRVIFLIEDDGPGIPREQYKNVFKPFFRLDKSRSLNTSGIGLGLAIVEDIVNSHGGTIQLGASNYKGLQVKISLPS